MSDLEHLTARKSRDIFIARVRRQDYAAALLFSIFADRSFLARSSSCLRDAVRFLPARLMKYVSIRIPEPGPFGDTFFDASVLAMTGALLLKRSCGGFVESVFTSFTHFFLVRHSLGFRRSGFLVHRCSSRIVWMRRLLRGVYTDSIATGDNPVLLAPGITPSIASASYRILNKKNGGSYPWQMHRTCWLIG